MTNRQDNILCHAVDYYQHNVVLQDWNECI